MTAHGRREVQDIIDRYGDDDREAFARAVAHLAQSSRDKWDEPHAKKLKGKPFLYEVRYRANRCATRALGFFGPNEETFTITLICTHKQNIYAPPDAINSAEARAKLVKDGTSSTVPLQIDGEDFPPNED
ncbi:type II toxin-antitoxin system RelE/ParE family toxin [Variovorax defluvii]|uniref:type II toxin-antitoxin system RelE/ParE family toxin n=1 Tax=Variovorax defluvii TaxID=913761 RepID=UPI0031E9D2F8